MLKKDLDKREKELLKSIITQVAYANFVENQQKEDEEDVG